MERFKIGERADGIGGDRNGRIGRFHDLYDITSVFTDDDHTDQLGRQFGVGGVVLHDKIVRFPFHLIAGRVFFLCKINDFCADLAGADEIAHIAHVGVNGFAQEGEPCFRCLDQILPQVVQYKKITDGSNDDADKDNERNRT